MIASANISALFGSASQAPADAAMRLQGAALLNKRAPMSSDQAEAAAKDFESMFIGQMLEQMFGESQGEEAFGDKDTDEVYKSLMMDEYGKQIAKSGGIGIASYVTRELLKLQEM